MSILSKSLLLCFFLLLPFPAFADTQIRPYSYSVVSSNHEYVFIMVAPVEPQDDGVYMSPKDAAESQRIRAKYKVSGLYRNNGSITPLWTVDWYAHFVLVASDGRHLIRRGYWTTSVFDEALTFFADGREIRSYRVIDLFYSPRGFPKRMEQFFWYERAELNESKGILTLTTTLGNKYVFDYTTGTLTSHRSPSKVMGALLAAGAVLALAAVLAYRRRKGVRKRVV